MALQVIDDPRLAAAVQENVDTSASRDYIYHVTRTLLAGRTSYLLGGAVRDPLVRLVHGTDGVTQDFDLLVDDSQEPIDIHTLFQDEVGVYKNDFGTVRWRPRHDVEIDVTTFTNANPIRAGVRVQPSLELWLSTCDFNTGSIAYDFQHRRIYDFKAMDGIRRKEIEVIGMWDHAYKVMTRLVLHAEKLVFSIGPRARELVREHYNPKVDALIKDYLHHKQKSNAFVMVRERLREIAQSS